MAKFARLLDSERTEEYVFHCPGCDHAHWVRVRGANPCWTWNGDPARPTVSPSLHVLPGTEKACHAFITNGNLVFLGDSWHALKGQTVAIPE